MRAAAALRHPFSMVRVSSACLLCLTSLYRRHCRLPRAFSFRALHCCQRLPLLSAALLSAYRCARARRTVARAAQVLLTVAIAYTVCLVLRMRRCTRQRSAQYAPHSHRRRAADTRAASADSLRCAVNAVYAAGSRRLKP